MDIGVCRGTRCSLGFGLGGAGSGVGDGGDCPYQNFTTPSLALHNRGRKNGQE